MIFTLAYGWEGGRGGALPPWRPSGALTYRHRLPELNHEAKRLISGNEVEIVWNQTAPRKQTERQNGGKAGATFLNDTSVRRL